MTIRGSAHARRGGPSEAEVVYWLKRALRADGFQGRSVGQIVVDDDPAYLHSRVARHLRPTGTVRIGDWRPDLVCLIDSQHADRVVAFEVKGLTDYEKGVVQAGRYREGAHEAYLCVPLITPSPAAWLQTSVERNGVGLVRAAVDRITVDVRPAPPIPDPRTLQTTRRYLQGQERAGALGLNKPLHYVAVLVAFAFAEEPQEALALEWGLQESALRLATRGAETLGLLAAGQVTLRGRAYADILRTLGFDLRTGRRLTRTRLADQDPALAAVLRTILLQHPAVDLIVEALVGIGGGPATMVDLARAALRIDEGMALAVFGSPPAGGQPWQIRSTTRFQLKAALYDVGLIDSRLARGAGGGHASIEYEPTADIWKLSTVSAGIDRFSGTR